MYPLKKIVFLKEIEETDLEKKQIISFSFLGAVAPLGLAMSVCLWTLLKYEL